MFKSPVACSSTTTSRQTAAWRFPSKSSAKGDLTRVRCAVNYSAEPLTQDPSHPSPRYFSVAAGEDQIGVMMIDNDSH
jgi:hypothetical protein